MIFYFNFLDGKQYQKGNNLRYVHSFKYSYIANNNWLKLINYFKLNIGKSIIKKIFEDSIESDWKRKRPQRGKHVFSRRSDIMPRNFLLTWRII